MNYGKVKKSGTGIPSSNQFPGKRYAFIILLAMGKIGG